MRNFLHTLFAVVVGISTFGSVCPGSHDFIDTAHAHASFEDSQQVHQENISNKEDIQKAHCCSEIQLEYGGKGSRISKSTDLFTPGPNFVCGLIQGIYPSKHNPDTGGKSLAHAQPHPAPFLLGNIVKRE